MHDESRTPLIVAAAALTRDDGAILVQRRPPGGAMAGLWEFPGGKLEPGETPEAALVRELEEELGVAVDSDGLEPIAFGTDAMLLLLLYRVRAWRGEVRCLAAERIAWVSPEDMAGLDMPPADRPLIRALRRP